MTISHGSTRFGVGASSRRVEDEALIRGAGCFTADIQMAGELHAVFVRSDHAHARFAVRGLKEAREASGVHLVWTAPDVAGFGPMPIQARATARPGTAFHEAPCGLICVDTVRKAGDVVAMIVADTVFQAQEASALLVIDYEPLPANAEVARALDDDAPLVWPEFGTNLACEAELGDALAADEAFARASHVAHVRVVHNRLVSNYLEPRAALAHHDREAGCWTMYVPSQGAHVMRDVIAASLGVPAAKVRVVTRDVGGGFGPKYFAYRDYPLLALASRELDRPVRWVCSRMEHFVSDAHGRDVVVDAELAIDGDGRAIGLRTRWLTNLGAYMSQYGSHVPYLGATMTSGAYDIPATHVSVRCVYTNSTPTDAYRGAGRPEAALTIERLMDEGARVFGISPCEFRKRNFIRPEQMPYRTATGQHYDCGEFEPQLDMALSLADQSGFPARLAESRAHGMLRGFGFATYIEACAFPGSEPAEMTLRADGKVILRIGTQATGQGHQTVYGQIIAEILGVAPEQIVVEQGDTQALASGGGTAGSRSIPLGVPSVRAASRKLARAIRNRAAGLLNVEEQEIALMDGFARAAATNRVLSLKELASAMEPEELTATSAIPQKEATYPNGTHVCELEIDPQTGRTEIKSFIAVDDFGVVVNPLLLEGQVHGGVAQGLGQALLERTVYDEGGQLLTAAFTDYAMPRADDIPTVRLETRNVPSLWNEMGIKGGGEAGAIGATPAIANAVVDALYRGHGIATFDLPATPERVWSAIRQAMPMGDTQA